MKTIGPISWYWAILIDNRVFRNGRKKRNNCSVVKATLKTKTKKKTVDLPLKTRTKRFILTKLETICIRLILLKSANVVAASVSVNRLQLGVVSC
jgi:hypothetical protein